MSAACRSGSQQDWPEISVSPLEWATWLFAHALPGTWSSVDQPRPARALASTATGEIASGSASGEIDLSKIESGLVARAKLGDADAFRDLVELHQQAIGQQMWRFSRQKEEWETLVHDVFVEAFLSLPRYRSEAPLVHWLRKIAVRVGYRFWKQKQQARSRQTEPLNDLADGRASATEPLDQQEQADRLHAVLAQLSPRDRLVITLLYLDERSTIEVAELTGMSRTLVKVQAFRARAKLKRLLAEESPT